MGTKPPDRIDAILKEASRWIDAAKENYDEPALDRSVAAALIALGLANQATIEYIRERDAEPHNHDKHMLDLGIEIGEQLSKRVEEK